MPWPLLPRLLAIGLPAGGESLSYNLSQASCLVFVNMMGTYAVTTRMYTAMFANCIYMLAMATGQAGQILVGYLVGARKLDDARACALRVLKMACPVSLTLALLLAATAGPLYGLFSSDPRIIALGRQIMLVAVSYTHLDVYKRQILFFPLTLLLAFLGIPAFVALIVDMWAWPVMEQVFHISGLRAERREKERAEEEAAQA